MCYYESENDLDAGEIDAVKAEIAKYLADYMMPDMWIRVAEMPRNLNGKIIRKDLPQPQMRKREITALDSEVLARVVWTAEDVLGISDAEPEDTFTELGGSSITAMKLSSFTITARKPNFSRHNLVCVDFPVPLFAKNK